MTQELGYEEIEYDGLVLEGGVETEPKKFSEVFSKENLPTIIFYGLIILVVVLIIIAIINGSSKPKKEGFRRLVLQQMMMRNKKYQPDGKPGCGSLTRGSKATQFLTNGRYKPMPPQESSIPAQRQPIRPLRPGYKPVVEPTTEGQPPEESIAKEIADKTIELIEEATGEQNDNMINPETGIVPTTEPLDVNSANSGYILDSTVNTDREPEITNKPVDKPVIEGYNYSRTSVGALENLMPASKFGLQETYQPMNIAMRKYVKSKK